MISERPARVWLREPEPMKIITWNVNQQMSHRRAVSTATWLVEQDADVILLQELTYGRHEVYEDRLQPTHSFFYARQRGDEGLHGAAVAVRKAFGGDAIDRIGGSSCPELVAGWRAPELGLVLSAHIPNGTNWGWEKMKVWQRIQDLVGRTEGRVVLGGDFNAPALEPDQHAGDYTICFGYRFRDADGGLREMTPTLAADLRDRGDVELPREFWPAWDLENRPEGTEGTGETWETIESWIYNRTDEHGLIDAYRAATDRPAQPQYSHWVGHRVPMRYDHIFVRGYEPQRARYQEDLLGRNIASDSKPYSDHAPLVVEVV